MGKGKRGRPSKKEQKTITNDMLGGFLVVFGLILAVFIGFKNVGSFAQICKIIFLGALGKSAYTFPILLMIVGTYCIMSEKRVNSFSEIRKGLIVIALIAATLTVFTQTNINIYSNPIKAIIDSVNSGIARQNYGGAIGTLLGGALAGIVGIVPARIIYPLLTFIVSLFLYNISFKQFFGAISYGFNYIVDHLNNVVNTLFRDDEVKKYEYTDNLGNKVPKLSRREKAQIEKEQEKQEKLREKGSSNVDENLNIDRTEQVEFDFNKLGGQPSEAEIKGKQKRDEFFKQQKEEKEDKTVKEVLTLDHTAHVEDENYIFPSIDLLQEPKEGEAFDRKSIHAVAVRLQKTLASFGVDARVTNITKGPTVTRYELTPSTGVKVSKIVNLADDIALNLAAKSIRIEAPIPGKAAVGIEVPNAVAESVMLREVIDSDVFKNHKSKLCFALGKNAAGEVCVGDIAKMPHMLIAGATGSGKSVCINSIIVSILYKAKPSEVKMILVDPKMVELSGYNGIPHLLIPVVTDPKKAAGALNWAVQEMVNRYNLFASKGVKDIKGYNAVMENEEGVKLPQIVIIIDELADLMMVAPNDVEDAICRLAQMARAAGMHLIIATQRPSVDVITGIIKANVPSRIAFTVSSQVDSRTILDMAGAEKLLGKGDMLYYPVGETKPLRMQGTFISETEIENIVSEIKENTNTTYDNNIIESIEKANGKNAKDQDTDEDDADELLNDAIDLVMDMGQASASMLQRKFKIGYSRAGRIVDQMEARGLISGYDGSKPRQVLISKEEWQELKMGGNDSANDTSDTATISNVAENVENSQTRSKIDIEL
ncbi:MAG: DNA translocase FtsK [Clostridia bacterium]